MADQSELPSLTFAEIKKLKVAELKGMLSSLGLPVSGLKADLVARLASFLESRALQAKLHAKDEEESKVADDGGSTDVLDQPGVTGDKDILIESQPDEPSGQSRVPDNVPEQVSAGQVVTEVAAERVEGDTPSVSESAVVVELSVESTDKAVEDVIDVDNQVPRDVMQVDVIVDSNESAAVGDEKETQQEEQGPEIEQEDKGIEIQEEIGVEVQSDRGFSSQPDEVGVEIQPDETRDELETNQIDSKEMEASTQEMVQTDKSAQEVDSIPEPADEDEIMVGQHESEKPEEIVSDIGVGSQGQVDKPQPVDVDQSVPAVVELDQSESTSGVVSEGLSKPEESGVSVEDMETETTEESVSEISTQGALQSGVVQEPVASVATQENVEDQQSLQPSSELPEESPSLEPPQPTSPSHQVPSHFQLQAPSHPPLGAPTQEQSQPPTDQMSRFPSHPRPESPSRPPTEALSYPTSQASKETEPTTLDRTTTPPRSAPRNEAAVRDAPPIATTPPKDTHERQETIPPPPIDPLAEAKAKARRVVEMRERRLHEESQAGTRGDDSGYDVDHYEQERIPAAESRQEKKKKKKKKRKKRNNEQPMVEDEPLADDEGVEVEYVPETLDFSDPVYAQFASIFETFKLSEKPEATKKDETKDKPEDKTADTSKKDDVDNDMDSDSEDEETQKKEEQSGEKVEKLSKKKLKLKNRMSVAELKQTVHRPDVVEMHDVTAPDPKLLVYLKACRNTVPVPRHWCFKRKFLQGKRGIIKPPFQLPEFIQKTGIMEMREALQEKEDAKNMKAKMREKIRPKMGKIDIDYQKLHDAFFKWQTKPKMSIHGDLYYEGKEFETKLKEKKPGDLSEDLRTALGMPTGQGSNLVPPPWLIAMQRYGPPPSYPNLKIPGLNAPIPEGASFGYHAGGWGKPPVDEHGRPLYGDVFGIQQTDANIVDDEHVDFNLWGELESESEESEESEEESEEEAPDQSGLVTPAETGLVTPSGLTSIPAGMETPDMIELRKRKNIEDAMESGSEQPTLYTVLPEKRAGVGGMMMGTSHVYDLATAAAPTGTRKAPGGLSEGVEVALDPSELELDPAAMQARYDEQLREQQNTQKEDLSDMVAEHAARQQKKRKKTTESGKAAKKYKEFKF